MEGLRISERTSKHPIVAMEKHRKCGDYWNKLLFV